MPNIDEEMNGRGQQNRLGCRYGDTSQCCTLVGRSPARCVRESLRFSSHAQIIQEPSGGSVQRVSLPLDAKGKGKARFSAVLSCHRSWPCCCGRHVLSVARTCLLLGRACRASHGPRQGVPLGYVCRCISVKLPLLKTWNMTTTVLAWSSTSVHRRGLDP